MLNQLEIQNFQSHQNTKLEFAQGVNVIMGTSHSGKSAVVRALRWVVTNYPKGFGFRRHGTSKKHLTDVTITSQRGVVTRKRNDTSTNGYTVNRELELEAMRGVVPEEVSAVLNMTELNIQSQFSPYFLIGESAGEVARVLNRYTGLEIIDVVTTTAIGEQTQAGHRVKLLKEQVEELAGTCARQKPIVLLKEKADTLKKLDESMVSLSLSAAELQTKIYGLERASAVIAEAQRVLALKERVSLLEESARSLNTLQESQQMAIALVSTLHATEAAYDTAYAFTMHRASVDALQLLITKHSDAASEVGALSSHIETMLDTQYNIDMCDFTLSFAKDITSLTEMCSRLETTEKSIQQLTSIFTEMEGHHAVITELETRKKGITEELAKIDICPLCGTLLDSEHLTAS